MSRCNFRESWKTHRRRLSVGCTLPKKANIEAMYLRYKTAQADGTIVDESGNGNDALLTQSFCGKFDGNTYARDNTKALTYTATKLSLKLKMKGTYKDAEKCVMSQSNSVSDRNYFITTNTSGVMTIYLSINGDAWDGIIKGTTDLMDGVWHTVEFTWENGAIAFKVDGIDEIYTGSFTGPLHISDAYFEISRGFSSYMWFGNLAYVEVGGEVFNLASGGLSDTLYNTGAVGGNAILSGATLPDFWSERQNEYHYNFLNGFDLYSNGTDGEEIRVPIGATVTTAGYSYVSTNLPGKWHNNAETKIQLPATLKAVVDGDCPNPLGYSGFKTNFNDAWSAFSVLRENEHKYLLFYDTTLTELRDKLKIQKCLKVAQSEYVLTDENGNVLTDENGIILVGE